MSSRRKQRKAEEQRVEQLLREQEQLDVRHDCELCSRPMDHEAPHHIADSIKSLKVFKDHHICYQCYQQLYRMHKDRTRARTLETLADVLADDQFQKYLKWVSKLPPETIYH